MLGYLNDEPVKSPKLPAKNDNRRDTEIVFKNVFSTPSASPWHVYVFFDFLGLYHK